MFTPRKTLYRVYVTRNDSICDADGVPGPEHCTVEIRFHDDGKEWATTTRFSDPLPDDATLLALIDSLFERVLSSERQMRERRRQDYARSH